MIAVGVDPGLTGAVGILKDGLFLAVIDIPTSLRGSGVVKREIDAAALRRSILEHLPSDDVGSVEAALERVNAMPGQGVSGVFSLGDSFGVCRAVITGLNLPLHLIPPANWKKHFGLNSDKEKSRALAISLFPKAELNLKKHADRSEALLIARYLWEHKFS